MKKEESKELKFCKRFSSLSMKKILKELNIKDSNFYSNKVSNEKEKKAKNKIIAEFLKIIVEDLENEE